MCITAVLFGGMIPVFWLPASVTESDAAKTTSHAFPILPGSLDAPGAPTHQEQGRLDVQRGGHGLRHDAAGLHPGQRQEDRAARDDGAVPRWAPEFRGRNGFPPREKHELVLSIKIGCADTVPFQSKPNTLF